jgi:hypothetical protein
MLALGNRFLNIDWRQARRRASQLPQQAGHAIFGTPQVRKKEIVPADWLLH